MIRLLLRSAALLALLAFGPAGCAEAGAPTADAVFRKVSEPALRPGDHIPDPTGAVVLSVSGNLGPAAGDDERIDLDMPALEALGLVEMTVDDRIAEGRTVVFQGVLLRVLLDAVQIDPGAATLTLFALNDYSVQIPIAEVYALPVLIATRADGRRMTIEHYGPLRIVYPFGLLPLQQAVHEPRSIWQLFRLQVE
jgi:hypothetical protein